MEAAAGSEEVGTAEVAADSEDGETPALSGAVVTHREVEVTEEAGGEDLTEIRTDRTTQAETRGAETMTPRMMALVSSRKRALRPTSLGRR